MPHSEAQAWWADVQHVRETIERRRAGLADVSPPQEAGTDARFERRAAAPLALVDDLDWAHGSANRPGGRSDHTGRSSHGDGMSARPRRPGADADHGAARWRRDDDHLEAETRRLRERRSSRRADDEAFEPRAAVTDEMPPAPLAPPSRRTVEITGRTVAAPPLPRLVEVERRRPPRRTVERVGPRPDRVALWAVLLGFFLILVAATSSRAATPVTHGHAGATVALHAPAPR
jgi:hypothetical protein